MSVVLKETTEAKIAPPLGENRQAQAQARRLPHPRHRVGGMLRELKESRDERTRVIAWVGLYGAFFFYACLLAGIVGANGLVL